MATPNKKKSSFSKLPTRAKKAAFAAMAADGTLKKRGSVSKSKRSAVRKAFKTKRSLKTKTKVFNLQNQTLSNNTFVGRSKNKAFNAAVKKIKEYNDAAAAKLIFESIKYYGRD